MLLKSKINVLLLNLVPISFVIDLFWLWPLAQCKLKYVYTEPLTYFLSDGTKIPFHEELAEYLRWIYACFRSIIIASYNGHISLSSLPRYSRLKKIHILFSVSSINWLKALWTVELRTRNISNIYVWRCNTLCIKLFIIFFTLSKIIN